ncbi:glycosyltransferase family 2 protein [Alteromonas sp. DY56-G5]|uniref:glycosyltransferase family 2 protein n=1 Tax=Alteromonas sp. DY56-G5 TaxID=2967128 RepID=UPI00352B83B2|tara:strand:- start:152 stop:1363 length:1212 start_codon:yes stop_codon:yes gene_type:complete
MINLFKSKKNQIKTKIVAVAKDEGAYLAEWVHHHLFLGFDAIDIYINRTSDNSLEILHKISEKYPQVNYFTADWVDLCSAEVGGKIQEITYALALDKEKQSKNFDYLMYLDIDEFWMPKDLATDINSVISKLKCPDSVSFQWINELGRPEAFSPLAKDIVGRRHKLVKTAFKVSDKVQKVLLHLPIISRAKMLLVDGKDYKPNEGQHEQLNESLSYDREVMIIHRMFRSPMEYVSLLNRGRPSSKQSQIKTNRSGYNRCMGEDTTFSLDGKAYQNYHQSYANFLIETSLSKEIDKAQKFIKQRYQNCIKAISEIDDNDAAKAVRAFQFTNDVIYSELVKKFGNDKFIASIGRPVVLREMASYFSNIDLKVALAYINRAKELHPKGPQILDMHKRIVDMAEKRS